MKALLQKTPKISYLHKENRIRVGIDDTWWEIFTLASASSTRSRPSSGMASPLAGGRSSGFPPDISALHFPLLPWSAALFSASEPRSLPPTSRISPAALPSFGSRLYRAQREGDDPGLNRYLDRTRFEPGWWRVQIRPVPVTGSIQWNMLLHLI